MKPDENQNAVSESTASNPSEAPMEQTPHTTTQPIITNSVPTLTPPSKFHKKSLIALAIVVVLVLAGGGAFALYHSKHHTKTNATATITSVTTKTPSKTSTMPVATNTWTGKDNNYNWNDANNWSSGIPTNNQILEINVASVKLPADGAKFEFQDNIPNLTIYKLVIDGQSTNTVGFNIKGSPLAITNGFEDTAVSSSKVSYSTEIQIDNQISFGGNATIQTTGHNLLTFYSANSGEAISLGSNTLQFTASDSSQIDVSGAIVGTGEVLLPNNAVSHSGLVMFETSSPNFNGKVVIGSGDSVNVGNQDNGGYGTVDAFGNSSVDIMNGGAMVLFAAGTTNFNVNNPISVNGSGITNSDGSATGAISACVTSAEEGCGASENITFTSQVKLLGNAQIGESTPSSLGTDNTHVNYTFNNLDKNGYTLNTVTDYYYSAEF